MRNFVAKKATVVREVGVVRTAGRERRLGQVAPLGAPLRPFSKVALPSRKKCDGKPPHGIFHVLQAYGGSNDEARVESDIQEPERDENGLYIGTYSNFFTDPAQIKGVIVFCGVLIAFFGGGQVLSGLLLPYLFGGARVSHLDVSSFDYWTKF